MHTPKEVTDGLAQEIAAFTEGQRRFWNVNCEVKINNQVQLGTNEEEEQAVRNAKVALEGLDYQDFLSLNASLPPETKLSDRFYK